ncbi:MAG: DNA methyltransferase [Aestuariivita sp.]|nr:DNA methyltransferase [Aestuariivita sp.]MCY4346745.1 DNA methyltransferase [Aestuariivita sp.]
MANESATPNFTSGTVWTGDNLPILRGMNSNCVDLIYLDPPFNSNRTYEAPIGSKAAGAAFKDMWTLDDVDVHEHGELADRNPAAYSVIEAARQAHGKGMMSYLIFMAVRLMEMHRVLKETGSIYVHCDPTASHYLKLLMDAIWGRKAFKNEIVWCYKGGGKGKNDFARKHDIILRYASGKILTFNADSVRVPYEGEGKGRTDASRWGSRRIGDTLIPYKPNEKGKIPEDWWPMPQLNSNSPERIGYPTQKPLALLDRIINASSNEGDMVLDPFCGCATACVAADRLGRKWAGIDLSDLAVRLVNDRINSDRSVQEKKYGKHIGGNLFGGATALTLPPIRTDLGDIPNYRTHRHRLYGEQEGICAGCQTHFPFRVMDVDHMLPRSRGGTDHPDNLQLLCSGCNRSKGGKTMAEWRAMK